MLSSSPRSKALKAGLPFDWIWSDQHFGHRKVIEYSRRPFSSVEEMDAELIANYCSLVQDEDLVLWLGDVSFHRAVRTEQLIRSLPGRKILVRGNHDRSARRMAELGFDLVVEEMVTSIAGRPARLSHYPYLDGSPPERPDGRFPDRRPRKIKGEVLLHGHTHQPRRRLGNQIHVGVDAWNFYPVSYHDIAREVQKIYGSTDVDSNDLVDELISAHTKGLKVRRSLPVDKLGLDRDEE